MHACMHVTKVVCELDAFMQVCMDVGVACKPEQHMLNAQFHSAVGSHIKYCCGIRSSYARCDFDCNGMQTP